MAKGTVCAAGRRRRPVPRVASPWCRWTGAFPAPEVGSGSASAPLAALALGHEGLS
jgi:hypothetical protein